MRSQKCNCLEAYVYIHLTWAIMYAKNGTGNKVDEIKCHMSKWLFLFLLVTWGNDILTVCFLLT